MSDILYEALESCLDALDKGSSLESCLEQYPAMTDELRPVLEAAIAAKSLSVEDVPVSAMQRSRTRLLARSVQLGSAIEEKPRSWFKDLFAPTDSSKATRRTAITASAGRMAFALVIAVTLILTSGGLLVVSAESLPGETLYAIKRAVEEIRVQLAPGNESQQQIEAVNSLERLEEVQELLRLGRSQFVDFEGVVETISHTQWIVNGIMVTLSPDTILSGPIEAGRSIELGMRVEVRGTTGLESQVYAQEIRLREYEIAGYVEGIEANRWIISGISIRVNQDTHLAPGIQVSSLVVALVRIEDDDNVIALAVVRLPGSVITAIPLDGETLTPTNTPQPSPTLTLVPAPSETPQPSSTPTHDSEEFEFTGIVETISSSYWVISGQIVYITAETEIEGDIIVGDTVRVHATIEANGSLTAHEIDKDESGGGGGPGDGTETDEPDESSTPEPTEDETSTPDDGGGHGGDDTPTPTP